MENTQDKRLIASSVNKSFIFRGALQHSLDRIVDIARVKNIKKGEALFTEGDPSEHVYVLASGRMTFFMEDGNGKRYVLGLIADYAIFGDMEVFTRDVRVSQAEAHEDCSVLIIDGADFVDIVKHDPEISFNIIRFYASLLQRLSRFSLFRNVEKQLAYILIDLAERYGKPVKLDFDLARPTEAIEINVSISQEFLASMLGVPRQRVNVALQTWKAQSWIRVNYNRITIINEPALRNFSVL